MFVFMSIRGMISYEAVFNAVRDSLTEEIAVRQIVANRSNRVVGNTSRDA